MSTHSLPTRPDLRQLRQQAKSLAKSFAARDGEALKKLREFHPRFANARPEQLAGLKLSDAQLVIARQYGFDSWPALKRHVEANAFERLTPEQQTAAFIKAACGRGYDNPSDGNWAEALSYLAISPGVSEATPETACAAGNAAALAEFLKKNRDLARQKIGPRKWEPLLYVAFSVMHRAGGEHADGLLKCARLLLDNGADPNCFYENEYKFPALYATIGVTRNLPLAEVLLQAGANPNDGQSLYHAAEHFDINVLDLLSRHGLEAKDVSYCLFHKLDFRRHEDGVRWFLEHGADPNTRHPAQNETPLHWAIKRGCSRHVLEMLLERGADVNARTASGLTYSPAIRGYTPLDIALRTGQRDAIDLLQQRGATSSAQNDVDQFVIACACADATAAARLKAHNPAMLKSLTKEDAALIAILAQIDNTAGAKLMLDMGFDPLAAGGWGDVTALEWAACRGNPELVKALLRKLKSPEYRELWGKALWQAIRQQWNPKGNYVDTVKLLLDAGAPVQAGLFPTGKPEIDALASVRQGA